MDINSILVFFHCCSNTGYAIEPLEKAFFSMSKKLVGKSNKIHFAYKHMDGGLPQNLPDGFKNIISFDPDNSSAESIAFISRYIKENNINLAFGFDQGVSKPIYRHMRKAGIKCLISYYGASMSSINRGLKLALKKVEVSLRPYKPDHFIFESNAMLETALNGRGISPKNLSVVYLGVDTEKYKPAQTVSKYAHKIFNIPKGRKIFFYSGHMEERKGVRVIIKAAVELTLQRKRKDLHFLITGNKNGEEKTFEPLYKGTEAEKYITFGGYRNDLHLIEPSCYAGTIASTGWDSFTMSALEMASCGLPLLVSNLQGLAETIEDGKTGYSFTPGNNTELADKVELLADNPDKQNQLCTNARNRVLEKFTLEKQEEKLVDTVKKVTRLKRHKW